MTFAAIRLLLAKAPAWVWLAVLGAITVGTFGVAFALHFEHKGEAKVRAQALADSVTAARAAQATDVKQADTAVAIANVEEKKATPLRQRARAALADTSNHVPPSVVAIVEAALAQDSTVIARKDTALDKREVVIVADAKLDTLTEHQLVLKPPGDGVTIGEVVKDGGKLAVAAGLAYEGFRAGRWLWRVVLKH